MSKFFTKTCKALHGPTLLSFFNLISHHSPQLLTLQGPRLCISQTTLHSFVPLGLCTCSCSSWEVIPLFLHMAVLAQRGFSDHPI